MCRLFGVIAESSISVEYPILNGAKPFVELSHQHSDGWGIGYLDLSMKHRPLRIARAPHPAYSDERFAEAVKRLASTVIIIHLRDAKYGEVALRNTHPFYSHGWLFAHNGSIEKYRDIEDALTSTHFEGETDSERYFQLVLKHIKQKEDVVQGICSSIRWLESGGFEGAKNFLMTDGRRLYAFRDGRDLFYAERESPLISPIYPKVGAASGAKVVKTVVVASEALTDETWHEVPHNHLLVVDENLEVALTPVVDGQVRPTGLPAPTAMQANRKTSVPISLPD